MKRAKFIGEDGSMGFRTGKTYLVSITYDDYNGWYWLKAWPSGLYCPYGSWIKLEDNWAFYDDQYKFIMHSPFVNTKVMMVR